MREWFAERARHHTVRDLVRRPALLVLGIYYAAVLFAGFLAPYEPGTQNRRRAFAPPSGLHFRGQYPIRFLVRDAQSRLHLFGVEEPERIFLLGSDAYGRDQFSRLLYGARISLLAGPLAAALSLGLGWLLGAISGFYGKWIDEVIMRVAELFLALPWLYLLFAVRAFLPLHVPPEGAFALIIAVVGIVGWARPARLVRGVVLSARQRAYVLAARGFGASDAYLLRRHVLPQTAGVVLTQATLLIPQYIMAEVTLSFLGLGVGEPAPSWGNMLAALRQYDVLVSYWWMAIPALALVPLLLAYFALANIVRRS